jgi:threonine dehydrogenase-like Zn-dependent dehydrogenase
MKHTYPRAIRLVESGSVNVLSLITHRVSLKNVAEAFALNSSYKDNVVKIIVKP